MTWRPPPPDRNRDARPIGESLERIATRFGLAPPSLLAQVFAHWEDLVGPDVARHATPRTLRQGVLTVVVDHPAWATSLRLLVGDLLARVDAVAGPGVVREVVVRVEGERSRRAREARS